MTEKVKQSSLKNAKFDNMTAEQVIKKYEEVLSSREKQIFELSSEIGQINQKIQKISSPESKLEIDIIQNPKNVIDFVKKDIIKQKTEKKYNKTCYNWSKNVLNNKRLYDNKKKDESLYNEVRKKNMLTDYIVLLKAKNNIKYSKLKEQYKI